jgi:hypothetical protein
MYMPGMVAHICNSSSREVEAGRLKVWGQPVLHSKTLSQKKKKKKTKNLVHTEALLIIQKV